MSLPKYEKYKESGVSWVGAIPSHWKLLRTKTLFELKKRPPSEEDGVVTAFRDGEVTLRSNRRTEGFTNSLQEIGYQGVRQGDLVIHAMDAFAGAIGVSDSDGKSTPVYSVCQPRHGLSNSRYYARLLRYMALSGFIESLAKGIRERSTEFRWAEAGNVYLPVPPIDEQTTIAAFLDRETAKIDALIAGQEKLIALLAEKRQATISHAVTKGLNPNAAMKDSGVTWLGEVPTHWDVCAVRRVLLQIEQGWSPECFNRPAEGSEWGVLKTGCVNGGTFNSTENKALPDALEPDPGIEVRDDDLLMSRASGSPALVGSVAYVSKTPPRLMLSDKIFRLHLKQGILPQFFSIIFSARYVRLQIEQAISGAEGLANNLPQSSLKGFKIAIPPEAEQVKLIAFVETEIGKLSMLADEAERAIALLKERRSALIAAAVTGQINVRGTVSHVLAESQEAIAA